MRFLLWPFALLYGLVIRCRNFGYNRGWLRSFSFDFPVILIGNLSTGGTGKTPHTELLIRLLKSSYKLTTLSRGYKRTYTGFGIATDKSLVEDIGDEPKLYKQKHPDIEVAVHVNRVEGVYLILQDEPDTQVILMDDGFQHRRIQAGFNILVSTYQQPFYRDYLLPVGRLREHRSNVGRAQMLIVSKCPDSITAQEMQDIRKAVQRYASIPVFFTRYRYTALKPLFADQAVQEIPSGATPLLLTGIAGHRQLLAHVQQQYPAAQNIAYADHHFFTAQDIAHIAGKAQTSGILITTEKDAMRLMESRELLDTHHLSVFVQPIEVEFVAEGDVFAAQIQQWLANFGA